MAIIRLARIARSLLGATAVAVTTTWTAPASVAQQTPAYPSKPLRMIVPFTPGGGADLTARTFAEKMATGLGQPVVVENKPGSNGVIGTDAVAKAAPDGYTILLIDRGALGINPSLYVSLPYDPLKSFAYIGIATEGPYVLVTPVGLGMKSVAELVALAKSKPLNYGSYGVGSMAQLNLEAFARQAGVKMVHIPYKGAAPAVVGAVQGDVAVTIASPPAVLGHLREKRLIALAVGSEKRLAQLPDVPTMKEIGIATDSLISTFFALAAPAATPQPIVERLNAELKRAASAPDLVEKLTTIGLIPTGSSPAEMTKIVTDDVARFSALVKSIGITPE